MNASTGRFTLPDRNVLAGGLAAVAAWGLSLLLAHLGMPIPYELVGIIVASAYGSVAYMIPPTAADFLARLDGVVRKAAASPATDTSAVVTAAATLERSVRIAARE